MRRKNAFAISVKAPSRGLVSRWPADEADRFAAGTTDLTTLYTGMALKRVFARAQNVRFEDGVVCAAPGYQSSVLVTPLLQLCLGHWRMEEPEGTRYASFGANDLACNTNIPGSTDPGMAVSATPGKFGAAAVLFTTQTFVSNGWFSALVGPASMSALFAASWSMTFWVYLTSVASVPTQQIGQFAGFSLTQTDGSLGFAGASTSTGVVAGSWLFVALTYNSSTHQVSIAVNNNTAATAAFTPPAPQSTDWTQANYGGMEWGILGGEQPSTCYVDSVTLWSVVLSPASQTALYNTGSGLDFPFLGGSITLLYEGNLIGATTAPMLLGTPTALYSVSKTYGSNNAGAPPTYSATLSSLYPATAPSTTLHKWRCSDFYDKIIAVQENNKPQYWLQGNGTTLDVPGIDPGYGSTWFQGCESFFGHLLLWQNDQIAWSDLNDFGNYIPVANTATSTLFTSNASFTQPAAGGTVDVTFASAIVTPLTVGQYVRLIQNQSQTVNGVNVTVSTYNYYQVDAGLSPTTTQARLRLIDKTGRIASGGTVNAGQFITCDANEAGAASTVGAYANGPIFSIVALGDYAYIFKEWSIQSLQYVGQALGTFQMRTEVVREGLLARNSWSVLGNGSIVFLGHRELYSYTGGPTPTPVCRQYTRQLLDELDRSKLDQVIIFHRERRNEVWVVYPVQGGQKVLIWNYVEDTASLDVYDPSLLGIVATVRTTWSIDPPWSSGAPDQTWASFADSATWASFSNNGSQELALLGTGNAELLIHGTVYDAAGAAYTALAETMDYDADDPAAFKYVDVIRVSLQVLATDNAVRTLYVQLGYRSTMDAAITWSTPAALQVQGGANFTAKANPGSGGGRFIRLRFYSQDADVQWRIAGFDIYGRMGGTY